MYWYYCRGEESAHVTLAAIIKIIKYDNIPIKIKKSVFV